MVALQAAWRAIVSTAGHEGPTHLDTALRAAIAIEDDIDTVAAIAGALLGARYGASAVPFEWRRRVAGWPPGLGHRDLVALGLLVARGGRPDPARWLRISPPTTYYDRHFSPADICVELPGHPGVLWGDVGAIASAEATAFVSLCRIGAGQRRGTEHHEVWLMDGDRNAQLGFVLGDTADAIEELRREYGSVFVHCVRAESRTPTVAAAWLMRWGGLERDAAIAAVLDALPGCAPNPALLVGLGDLGT